MASGLDWKMVELQIENLVPGILLTVELSSLIPGLIEGTKGTGNSFVDGTVFHSCKLCARFAIIIAFAVEGQRKSAKTPNDFIR
jgi:hypothetical protein